MSSGVNVLRYSALGLGVFYGFYHQRSITAAEKKAAAQREYEHKQDLINKAKEAYAKSKQPAAQTTSASAGLNQDLTDPKFDLESFVEGLMKAK
ncbi:hypothetical protein N656DRAFT_774421 [Canariomyces notabilis]|uniref:ATP synthase F(0) complex subunit e, mitochondrial n=1 Tax=Canariomyces notabilis TaxID=2074819 RepID=A0AAN6YW31_9PEZI|nr:hypothetical protein N656DRAFT_774421 [Canariomyces arenarius]